MKPILLATTLLLVSAGYALAGPGTGEPTARADPSSGRPTAILDDATCSNVWSLTQRQGDTLSEGEAAPLIVNFKLVDANGDGKGLRSRVQGRLQERLGATSFCWRPAAAFRRDGTDGVVKNRSGLAAIA
jgi:hypothetical protein